MSTDLKAKVQRFIDEVWNQGNLAAADEFCADTIILHHPPYPVVEGLAAYRKNVADMRAIWPDMKMIVEEMIVEGDTVVARGFWSGTQTGTLRWTNLPPTGKAVKAPMCAILHMQDGKVIEEFEYLDNLGMLRQLGLGAA